MALPSAQASAAATAHHAQPSPAASVAEINKVFADAISRLSRPGTQTSRRSGYSDLTSVQNYSDPCLVNLGSTGTIHGPRAVPEAGDPAEKEKGGPAASFFHSSPVVVFDSGSAPAF